MIITHGSDLIRIWPKCHKYRGECGRCGEDVLRVGITSLVYTFEPCDCGEWPYIHLVETLWHRVCFQRSEARS